MDHYDSRYGGRKKFSMGNIFGDPFPLATLGIGIVRHPLRNMLLPLVSSHLP